jgi:hypothetical protein
MPLGHLILLPQSREKNLGSLGLYTLTRTIWLW